VSSSRASAITTKTSPHILEGSRNGYTTPRDLTAQGVHSGHITEAFATGTAAVVAPLGELLGESGLIAPATSSSLGPVGSSLRRRLTDIQFGFAPDAFGWMHRVGPTR
jgi:hypothetical protein